MNLRSGTQWNQILRGYLVVARTNNIGVRRIIQLMLMSHVEINLLNGRPLDWEFTLVSCACEGPIKAFLETRISFLEFLNVETDFLIHG